MEIKQRPDVVFKMKFKNGQVRAVPLEQIVSLLNYTFCCQIGISQKTLFYMKVLQCFPLFSLCTWPHS